MFCNSPPFLFFLQLYPVFPTAEILYFYLLHFVFHFLWWLKVLIKAMGGFLYQECDNGQVLSDLTPDFRVL